MSHPSFKHEPLDQTQPTIRVLRISRFTSKNGLIRCKIKHTTTNSKYTCLSYHWGEPNDGGGPFDILVNKKIYKVRQNLYQFLQRAKDHFLKWLWIDAICIDQDNTLERNHQVQHMGKIYSRAEEVLVWLGESSDVARFLHSASPWWFRSSHCAQSGKYSNFAVFQTTQSYWKRAWVTQEIFLARRIRFMARAVIARPEKLAKLYTRNLRFTQEFKSFRQLMSIAMKLEFTDVTNLTLVELLQQMQHKQCFFPRDKIYSLLSLCKDGRSMDVDYDQPDAAFLFDTFHRFSVSCLCMAKLFTDCVVQPLDSFEGQRDTHSEKIIAEMRFKSVKIKTFRTTGNGYHMCSYCAGYLGRYIQRDYHVFCLHKICANAPGHLLWMQSHPHVLQYQGLDPDLRPKTLQPIVANWGLIYASNTTPEEHVLRFTLKGLADIVHCIDKMLCFSYEGITLCRHTMMDVTERTKSEFGGWSILDPGMGEQDEELDC